MISVIVSVIGNVLLFVSALIATVFVVLYWLVAPWWRSATGRNIQALMAVLAAVLNLSVIRVWVPVPPDTWWFAILRVIVFAPVPIVLGSFLWHLIKIQILDRRRNGATRDQGD